MQIFINLIENAIKYTPEKGSISLSCALDGDNVTFTLKDTGVGIDKTDLPFIFDRFYRSDKSRIRQDIGGSGIGLSLVKFLVELFAGKIFVASELGAGELHLPWYSYTAITAQLFVSKQACHTLRSISNLNLALAGLVDGIGINV